MKTLNIYINEWKLTSDNNSSVGYRYKYFPKDEDELASIIAQKCKENEERPYLLDIDTSKITDMWSLFSNGSNGVLKQYNVDPNKFICLDLTSWDVSNVGNFVDMFYHCDNLKEIKGIENWNIDPEKVHIDGMFDRLKSLETEIPDWYY